MTTPQGTLFDAQGPQGRRRTRIATWISLAVIAVLLYLAIHRFGESGQLASAKWTPFLNWPIQRFLLQGLEATLLAAAVAAGIALPVGALAALGRLSRRRPIRLVSAGYVELFRSLPLLLIIFFVLVVPPRYGLTLPRFWELAIPLAIPNSALLAEIFRAGILSLERGQTEAGYSVGLRYWQLMRLIVLPQAVRRMIPALVSQVIFLLKGTSLGYVVSYQELLFRGRVLGEFNHTLVQSFLIIAAIYVVINASLSKLSRTLEARQTGRSSRTGRARVITVGREQGVSSFSSDC